MIREFEIIKQITETRGTNDKIEILKRHADNVLLKDMLNVAFNPLITTNIAEKKISKNVRYFSDNPIEFNTDVPDASIFNLMEYVKSENCTGKDCDIYWINEFLSNYSEEEIEIMKAVVTKKLSIGMSIKNINKAIPGFFTIISPMLAYDFAKYSNLDREYCVTLKLDGYRLLVKCDDDGIRGYSRSGIEEEFLNEFFKKLELPKGYYYDGELLSSSQIGSSMDRFRETATILREKRETNPELITFNIFDMIPIEEIENEECTEQYSKRRTRLESSVKDNKYQRVIPVLMTSKIEAGLFDLLEKVVEGGEEGLMLNWIDGVYENKRSKNLLKMKMFKEVDLRCVGINEGRGKYKGTLGSIDVSYKGNIVSVPSMSDELRNYYWNNPSEILGKIVSVKYFEESMNKNGDISLRLPSFKTVRLDKNTESYE